MYQDVQNLRDFYYRSVLGRSVQARLQKVCVEIWPDLNDEIVAGFGFASPLLRPFLGQASHLVNLMPAEQGVMAWPPGERNVSVLCGEHIWPLGASSVDRVLMLHALEGSQNVSGLFNEAWRVLTPEGRMILIVVNRGSAWARNEETPFGFGRPFRLSTLDTVLRAHQFEVVRREGALFGAPWKTGFGLRISKGAEWMAEKLPSRGLAGVWLLEIQKTQMQKPIMIPRKEPIFASPDLRPAQL